MESESKQLSSPSYGNSVITPEEEYKLKSKIELGTGKNPLPVISTTADLRSSNNPDIVIDLDDKEWDLPSNHFKEVYIHHCLEHLTNWQNALQEIHRILKPEGKLYLWVPHASISILHPDHKTHFGLGSFEKHCDSDNQEFIGSDFEVVKERVAWRALDKKSCPRDGVRQKYSLKKGHLLGRFIDIMANSFLPQRFYTWFGGFDEIYVEMEAQK